VPGSISTYKSKPGVTIAKSLPRVAEPRLRFDKVAVGLVQRLQANISKSVPKGMTVIVTITAPIRQDSSTRAILEHRLRELLAAQRAGLNTTILGNRIGVRVLTGGKSGTPKLIGFVHNPKPDPALLFDAARSLLACMGSGRRSPTGGLCLLIDNQDGLSPLKTYQHVCSALGAWSFFRRILVANPGGAMTTLRRP
jgi:hypothetical protein